MQKTGWMCAIPVMAALVALGTSPAQATEMKGKFIHHVYFWLKHPNNIQDREKLVTGLKTLASIKTIRAHHIGKPAATDRPVIDRSYSISWMLVFDNKADQDAYQVDPVHLAFVEKVSPVWDRVIVYDSEAID